MAAALAVFLLLPCVCSASTAVITQVSVEDLPCRSAILMDAKTGEVLYEQNADEALPPASVTKVMTLLLVMEAIESGRIKPEDMVRVSENAASMGGSQVFLEPGEQMCVEEMLKCVVIASANDCAVALAEHVAGSEESFVAAMNARAVELGMKNTHFENTNGLDDTVENHVTSARDVAIMSCALIAHPKILEYSGIWMDTIRDGAFGLTNTNRLVRYYPGCTGLKTGSTARAGFCVSASAEREGVSLICVIMGAQTRDVRNESAAKLLDFGFAHYETFQAEGGEKEIKLTGSQGTTLTVSWPAFGATVPKGDASRVESRIDLPESVAAPVEAGAVLGHAIYTLGDKELGRVEIRAVHDAPKMEFWGLFYQLLSRFFLL